MSAGRVVWAVAALSIAVELVLQLADLGVIDAPRFRASVYEHGGFWPGLLGDWRPNFALQPMTMFLSYGVLHAGLLHLAVNMLTLAALASQMAGRIDGTRFAALYAVSTLGGGVGYALLAETYRPMVGASGALFGLFGALLVWEFDAREDRGWLVGAVLVLFLLNAALFLAMDLHLAWQAHLGGFFTGGLAGVWIRPRIPAD